MPQKIDIHGIFIDPGTITGLQLQKRIAVHYPVFHEIEVTKTFWSRFAGAQNGTHILNFVGLRPYGIILADPEQPDPASHIVNYKEAAVERFLRGIGQAGKNITGHITEMLKIEVAGDRQYRILQPGRNVKNITIREIPCKVKLLSGQWVDVQKSTPGYDFQGGSPYAVTDVDSSALLICTKEKTYVLYGAGVDASEEEVVQSYRSLTEIYNQIQSQRDVNLEEPKGKLQFQIPQIKIQLPKIEMPQLKIQQPFVRRNKDKVGKNDEDPK